MSFLTPEILRYGELGLLAAVIYLGYKLAQRLLTEGLSALNGIGRDCHAHQTAREERLIQVIEQNQRNQERFINAVEELKTAIRRSS